MSCLDVIYPAYGHYAPYAPTAPAFINSLQVGSEQIVNDPVTCFPYLHREHGEERAVAKRLIRIYAACA